MKRFSLLLVVVAVLAFLAAPAGVAGADPTRQPFNGKNCHGFLIAHGASNDPEGLGNFVGGRNVENLQDGVRFVCDLSTGS